MIRRDAGSRRSGRLIAAGLIALAPLAAVPAQAASEATAGDRASQTVTLDAPGTVTLDAFDPDLGSLTRVEVSLRTTVLVQNCIENLAPEDGTLTAGLATGSLAAQFPDGVNPTLATAEASVDPVSVGPSDGTADCDEQFDADAGRFPQVVEAGDVTYFQDSGEASNSATLTAESDLAPYVGTGTVSVAYTPGSDTELALPAQWDTVAVAQGQVVADVAYTYTPGSGLASTGATILPIVLIALVALVLGFAALLVAKRLRGRDTTG